MFQWRNEDGYRKGTWDSLNEVLRDDVLEISEVRGGIWRDNVILEEDLTNATVMITARSNIDNWDPERSDRTKRAVRNETSLNAGEKPTMGHSPHMSETTCWIAPPLRSWERALAPTDGFDPSRASVRHTRIRRALEVRARDFGGRYVRQNGPCILPQRDACQRLTGS